MELTRRVDNFGVIAGQRLNSFLTEVHAVSIALPKHERAAPAAR